MVDSMMVKMGVNVMHNRLVKNVPDYNAPSHFKVGITTTDVDWADTELNDSVIISGTSYTKILESITLDETNGNITLSGWLSVTEANGNLLTGFAVVNDDTTEKLITKSKFTGISKTNTELFKFSLRIKTRDKSEYP